MDYQTYEHRRNFIMATLRALSVALALVGFGIFFVIILPANRQRALDEADRHQQLIDAITQLEYVRVDR